MPTSSSDVSTSSHAHQSQAEAWWNTNLIAHYAKLKAHANATFFAAQVVGAPASGETPFAVWLVAGPEDFSGGLTLAVDAYAKVYSVAPDGTKSKAEVSIADPPAGDLQRFVAGHVK